LHLNLFFIEDTFTNVQIPMAWNDHIVVTRRVQNWISITISGNPEMAASLTEGIKVLRWKIVVMEVENHQSLPESRVDRL
jgi:hypothetical protein